MERQRYNILENRSNSGVFFPVNPPAVNMAELMRQTHHGYYPPMWEVYHDSVGDDGVRRLERFTPDRKVSGVEEVRGWARYNEHAFTGGNPGSRESYIETDRSKDYRTLVSDILVVWRDYYGNPIQTMGNNALLQEFNFKSEDLISRHESILRQQEIFRQQEARRQEILRQQEMRRHQEAIHRHQEMLRYHQEALSRYHEPASSRSQEVVYQQPNRPEPPLMPRPEAQWANTVDQFRFPYPPNASATITEFPRQEDQGIGGSVQQPVEVATEAHVTTQVSVSEVTRPQMTTQAEQSIQRKRVRDVIDENVDKLGLGLVAGVKVASVKLSEGKDLFGRLINQVDRDFIERDPVIAKRLYEVKLAARNGEELEPFSWKDEQLKGGKASINRFVNRLRGSGEETTVEKTKIVAGRLGKGLKKGTEVAVMGISVGAALTQRALSYGRESDREAARKMSVPIIDFLNQTDEKKVTQSQNSTRVLSNFESFEIGGSRNGNSHSPIRRTDGKFGSHVDGSIKPEREEINGLGGAGGAVEPAAEGFEDHQAFNLLYPSSHDWNLISPKIIRKKAVKEELGALFRTIDPTETSADEVQERAREILKRQLRYTKKELEGVIVLPPRNSELNTVT